VQIRPWLLRVAHNASVDMLRRQALETGAPSELEESGGCPVDVLEERRELRAVVREIGRLPERQRQALLLRAVEGHGYEEIARALGASEGVVRQLIYRARERIRAAAAAVVAPVWLLRRAVRAAPALHGPAASGTAVKVGVAVTAAATGIAVVGGVNVGHRPNAVAPEDAHAAVVSPERPAQPLPKVTLAGEQQPLQRRVRLHAAKKVQRPGRKAAPAPAHQAPAPTPRARPRQASPSPPRRSPASQSTRPPTHPPPPASPPAHQPQPEPDPPAAGPSAPVAAGQIVTYEQGPGFGGPLTVQRTSGEHVTAFFGELVELSCWFVRNGHVVSHETCTKERLHSGVTIARAEHALNSSGHDVWTHVELILPARDG
jgi:DNA-binding CsgD family transcriptional regulator